MKILRTVLIIICFSLIFNVNLIFSQTTEKSKNKSVPAQSEDKNNSDNPGEFFPKNEVKSPFRYVIVENDLQFDVDDKTPVRRFVDVLMDEKAFNEANLIYLFNYLSNYYADPQYLNIEVHTSLMTLETLEESTALSTHSSRADFRQLYKTAGYSRFNNGSEGFDYVTGKPGKFIRKFVNLPRKTNK